MVSMVNGHLELVHPRRVQVQRQKKYSLAKDRNEVLLTTAKEEGSEGHEAWMTGRQASRYGVGV